MAQIHRGELNACVETRKQANPRGKPVVEARLRRRREDASVRRTIARRAERRHP